MRGTKKLHELWGRILNINLGLIAMMVISVILHSECIASTTDEYHSTTEFPGSTADASFSTTQMSYSDGNVTTSSSVTDCDLDFPSCTSESFNSTTSEPQGSFKNKTKEPPVARRRKAMGTIDYCTCDLQLNYCDINCCCDEDCSSEDKQIFAHCQVENRVYDTRYCEYMKYIYVNNTPFEWRINQNDFFCVVKSNLPPFYLIQRKRALKTFGEAEKEKTRIFLWRVDRTPERTQDIIIATDNFVYGNRISIVQHKNLRKFELPNKFITNKCLIKEKVRNLKDIKNTCVQDVISENNQYLSMREYFEDIYVIASPSSFNVTKYSKNSFQDCPRNVCLPILPKICNEHFGDCVNITKNDTRIKMMCSFIQSKNLCVNLVKKIQYNFYHNGTSGFTKIVLLAQLQNVTNHFWKKDLEFPQEFSVNFWWTNQTRNYSEILSGNPGYLVGKPILIGKLTNIGNTTHQQLFIKRNSSQLTDNFLTLPESEAGVCVSDEINHVVVEFGYDQLTKCKYLGNIVRRKKINATDMCRDMQRSVFKLWRVNENKENLTFGSFGNANSTAPSDWLRILYRKAPESILNSTFGTFNSKTNLLSCFGIATSWSIDLFHSKLELGSLHNQEKLLAVTYSFGEYLNKTFVLNKNSNALFFEVKLQSQVTFHDISKPKVRKVLDPPSLDIRLPYDFFYPFVKIDNAASKNPTYASITYFVSIIVVFFHERSMKYF